MKAVKAIFNNLKKVGISIMGRPEITVQNIVAQADLGGPIDLVEFPAII